MPSSTRAPVSDGDDYLFFDYAPSRRLKKGWEFDAVFRTGRQQRGELVRLCYLRTPRGRGAPARVGVTVGRRIANAAGRARGRRILRESFRRLMPWMRADVWAIASLREAGLAARAQTVYMDLAKVLQAARLLKDEWPGADWTVDSRCSRIFSQPRRFF